MKRLISQTPLEELQPKKKTRGHSLAPTCHKDEDVIVCLGNPGSGKSTILNSMIGQLPPKFKSGFSLGVGMTNAMEEYRHEGHLYVDTPGLADPEMRERAAKAIDRALHKRMSCKVLFVITLEAGGLVVRPQDRVTMELVLEAVGDQVHENQYGIVINKVPQENMIELQEAVESGNFGKNLSHESMPITDKIYILPEEPEIEDTNDRLLLLPKTFLPFIASVSSVKICPDKVKDINWNKFERIEARLTTVEKMIMRLELENAYLDMGLLYVDTLGLTNPETRESAAQTIDEQLKKGTPYKILFVITIEVKNSQFVVKPQDQAAMELVFEALAHGMFRNQFGILIDKVSQVDYDLGGLYKAIQRGHFVENLPETIPSTDMIYVLPEKPDVTDEINTLLPSPQNFLHIIPLIPSVMIRADRVTNINWGKFEELLASAKNKDIGYRKKNIQDDEDSSSTVNQIHLSSNDTSTQKVKEIPHKFLLGDRIITQEGIDGLVSADSQGTVTKDSMDDLTIRFDCFQTETKIPGKEYHKLISEKNLRHKTSKDLAHRGIRLRDLLQFYSKLGTEMFHDFNPNEHSTHDVARKAIIPNTATTDEDNGISYAEKVSGGAPVLAERMVSHTWSNKFKHLIAAIVADAMDVPMYKDIAERLHPERLPKLIAEIEEGKMDIRYWVCALCVNQHRVCNLEFCNCRTRKYSNGHPACEVDKFDEMFEYLVKENMKMGKHPYHIVAIDQDCTIFGRSWVLAELVFAESEGLRLQQKFRAYQKESLKQLMEEEIDIRNAKASREDDEKMIIDNAAERLGIEEFNRKLNTKIKLLAYENIQEIEEVERTKMPHILCIGNSGVGTTTLLKYMSGDGSMKFTKKVDCKGSLLQEHTFDGKVFIEVPGLADDNIRRKAARAISSALKRIGTFKIFFVVTLEAGRARPEDTKTMLLVLETMSFLKSKYTVIINKATPTIIDALHNDVEKQKLLRNLFPQGQYGDIVHVPRKITRELDDLIPLLSIIVDKAPDIVMSGKKMHDISEETNQEKLHFYEQELDRLKKEKGKPRNIKAADLLESHLMGNVFVRDRCDVGYESIHFDEQDGCYVSWEHAYFSNEKKDDGTALPSRILFTEQKFDSEERRFSGLINFQGIWGGVLSRHYELVFDTQFLCIVSGKTVLKKVSGETQTRDTFGKNCCYTNMYLEDVADSNEEVVKRLENEGANEKSIRQIIANVCKQVSAEKQKLSKKFNAASKTFGELTEGYYFTTRWVSDEEGRYSLGEERTEWVGMNQPRPCSYQKYNHNTQKSETIPLVVSSLPSKPSISPAEYRAITLTQLRAVMANIVRRCRKEKWRNYSGLLLSPNTVTLYDVDKYVNRPFTKEKQLDFVSCLPSTAGPQPPRFFASHWWGMPVVVFIAILEQHIRDFGVNRSDEDDKRGGGMTTDTPIWVCAYGNNQWDLEPDLGLTPLKYPNFSFVKALTVAEWRSIVFLDKEGKLFTRALCCLDIFIMLMDKQIRKGKEGVLIVYTGHSHIYKSISSEKVEQKREAVGIIPGGAPVDGGDRLSIIARECAFPFDLIVKASTSQVQKCQASEKIDRINVLNYIAGNTGARLNDSPPRQHPKYDEFNDTIRSFFMSTIPRLQDVSNIWLPFLVTLSNGRKDLNVRFDFNEDEWVNFKADSASQLIANLPHTTVKLIINCASRFGVGFVDVMIKHVYKSNKLSYLGLSDTYIGGEGQEVGIRLADAIASNSSITVLVLERTDLIGSNNVKQWRIALTKNKTLTGLSLSGVEDEIVNHLKEATKDRIPQLDISKRKI